MNISAALYQPSDEEVSSAQQIQQLWAGGNQAEATRIARELADRGKEWAVALVPWLVMQQGVPTMEQGIPYAKKAVENGMPWVALHLFNNLMGNLGSAPHLLEQAMELGVSNIPWGVGIDPVGLAWNAFSQGKYREGIQLMSITLAGPITPDDWSSLLADARQRLTELDQVLVGARERERQVIEGAESSRGEIEKAKTNLETNAKQAGLLVSAVVSDSTNSLFKAEAVRNTSESKTAWRWGLVVLGAAAVVAVLPLFIHYIGRGPSYSTTALVGAHFASTAALATFSGVLLARARSRDQAAQRAHDLSTAMGTMISYSNQIADPAEKERFMMTMGQLVLQAHLTSGSGQSKDESVTGLIALANLVRPSAPVPNS